MARPLPRVARAIPAAALAVTVLSAAAAPAQTLTRTEINHALRRMTFGPRPELLPAVGNTLTSYLAFVTQQLNPASIPEHPDLALLLAQLAAARQAGSLSPPTICGPFFPALREIQYRRLVYALLSTRAANEKMTQVLEQHFNTGIYKVRFVLASKYGLVEPQLSDEAANLEWSDNQMFRANAFGNFKAVLTNVTKSPAMMMFLDQVNNACTGSGSAGNENYGREVLELYTMSPFSGATGLANYTQADVQSVARILSGWELTAAPPFVAVFNPGKHCAGSRTLFIGTPHQVTVPAVGAQQLDLLIAHLANADVTREFICRKLLRIFVADGAGDPGAEDALLAAMKTAWGNQGGDLRAVMDTLFKSTPFLAAKYRRSRAGSPLENVIGLARLWGGNLIDTGGSSNWFKLRAVHCDLDRIGQLLFEYPAPDGFPYESEEQPGSSVWIETAIANSQTYRQLFQVVPPWATYPNFDFLGLVFANVGADQRANPAVVARFLVEWTYDNDYTPLDLDIAIDTLSRDVNGVVTPLNPANLVAYAERLALTIGVLTNYVNGFLK